MTNNRGGSEASDADLQRYSKDKSDFYKLREELYGTTKEGLASGPTPAKPAETSRGGMWERRGVNTNPNPTPKKP